MGAAELFKKEITVSTISLYYYPAWKRGQNLSVLGIIDIRIENYWEF